VNNTSAIEFTAKDLVILKLLANITIVGLHVVAKSNNDDTHYFL